MAIYSTSNTILTQYTPKFSQINDLGENQVWVYDSTKKAFVNIHASVFFADVLQQYRNGFVETIECLSAVGDGNQQTFILPWRAVHKNSLVVTKNGLKLHSDDYQVQILSKTTNVTFNTIPEIGDTIDVVGFQVIKPENIKKFSATGNDEVSSYDLPWIANSEHSLLVFIEGLKILENDFTVTYLNNSTSRITFENAINDGDQIDIIGLQGFAANEFRSLVATGNGTTTTFNIPWRADGDCQLYVTVNGVKLTSEQYQVTAQSEVQSQVVFHEAPDNAAEIEFYGILGLYSSESILDPQVTGNNLGSGSQVYNSVSSSNGVTTLNFRSIEGGPGIKVTSGPSVITIESDEVISGLIENVGAGAKLLVEPVNEIAQLRSLSAGDRITITQNNDTIEISATGDATTLNGNEPTDFATTISSVGLGESLIKKSTAEPDSTFQLYSLKAGNGIVVTRVNDTIYISDKNGGNYVTVDNDYSVEMDDAVVGVDTSAPRTITLPDTAIAGPGKVVTIKDETFEAGSNNIIIQGVSSQLVDGTAASVIEIDGGSATFYTDGTNWFSMSSSGSGATSLNQLSDVNTVGATGGQVLRYNGTTWIASDETLNINLAAGAIPFGNGLNGLAQDADNFTWNDSTNTLSVANLVIPGDLIVQGTTTTINTSTMQIEDPLITLGKDNASLVDLGIVGIRSGGVDNVAFIWDESADRFALILTNDDGSTAGNVAITGYADLKMNNIEVNALSVQGPVSGVSIDDLSDVDTSTVEPEIGEGLVWNGTNWIPGNVGGGAVGEANVASNLPGGTGLFAQKLGVNLQFKSLVAGSNISLSSNANTVTIAANPFALDTITDVTITSPQNNQPLVFNGSAWINGSVSATHVSGLSAVATSGSYDDLDDAPEIPSSISDLDDVDTVGAQSNDLLSYNGTNWVPFTMPTSPTSVERVVLRYTAGSGGDLSAVDAIVSETAGISATIVDGANCIVEFTFDGYIWPANSIVTYGHVYSSNQFEIRTAANLANTGTAKIVDTGSSANPDLLNPAAGAPPVLLQLRMSDTGASAGFGQRAQVLVQFLMGG